MAEEPTRRKPHLYEAILSFAFLIFVMAMGIAKFGANPHIPMLIGTIFSALIALKIGFSWDEIQQGMFDGINQAM